MDTNQQLAEIYSKLLALSDAGDRVGAQAFLKEKFDRLPDDVQADIMTRMYFAVARQEADETDVLAQVQEKGLEVVEALRAVQKKLHGKGSREGADAPAS